MQESEDKADYLDSGQVHTQSSAEINKVYGDHKSTYLPYDNIYHRFAGHRRA